VDIGRQGMVTISSAAGLVGFEFSFEPGARTAWDTHPPSQKLIVTARIRLGPA